MIPLTLENALIRTIREVELSKAVFLSTGVFDNDQIKSLLEILNNEINTYLDNNNPGLKGLSL